MAKFHIAEAGPLSACPPGLHPGASGGRLRVYLLRAPGLLPFDMLSKESLKLVSELP